MEHINLNMVPNGVPSVCHVSQFDNSDRKIRFHLLNGSDPYTLSGTETIKLRIRKQNNEVGLFDIANTSSDYIDLIVLQPMSDVAGDSECEFQILDTGSRIGSFNFKMKVEPDAFDGQLATGSIAETPVATFQTDLAEDLIRADVILEPIQDLHGYDHPWPAGGGKNLVDWRGPQTITTQTTLTEYATSKQTKYTISVYAKNTGTINTRLNAMLYDDNTLVVQQGKYITPGTDSRVSFTIDTTSYTYNKLRVVIAGQSAGYTTIVSDLQVEEGSTATSFAPYENLCPISGHDEATLERDGKNLFDKSKITNNAYVSGSTGEVTHTNGYFCSDFIKALPNTSYVTNTVATGVRIMVFYDKNKNYLGTTSSTSYVTPNGTAYIRINGKTSDITADSVQLEVGSTATTYEPFISDPTPITVKFGQTVYQGKLYSENRYIEVTHKLYTFTGSEAYGSLNNNRIYCTFLTDAYIPTEGTEKCVISSHYKGGAQNGYSNSEIYKSTGNVAVVFVDDVNGVDTTTFKTFLANQYTNGTPVTAVYKLAEPFIIDLTQQYTASISSTPIASFETTVDEPLEKLECEFSATQDLHGYDKPWPAGGGKNKFAVPESTSTTYGVTLTRNSDGSITLNGLCSSAGNFVVKYTLPAGTYTLSCPYSGTLPNNGAARAQLYNAAESLLVTIVNSDPSSQARSITIDHAIEFDCRIRIDQGFNYQNVKLYPQVEAGSTATSFEPYSNICPIAGVTEINAVRCGKNLLNLSRTNIITSASGSSTTVRAFTENDIWVGITRNNYFNNERIASYSVEENKVKVKNLSDGYGIGFPIRCKPLTTYYMFDKEGNTTNIGFYDVNGNNLSNTQTSSFTTPANCVWLLVVFSGSANVEMSFANPQLELGSSVTSYESGIKQCIFTDLGVNQWDEKWEVGDINRTTGQNASSTTQIRSKNYIPALGGSEYRVSLGGVSGSAIAVIQYTSSKTFIKSTWLVNGERLVTDSNTVYIRFTSNNTYGNTYNNDISINYPATDTSHHPHQIGFNQWDEEWELGTINTETGEKTSSTTTIRSKNNIIVQPQTQYCMVKTDAAQFFIVFFDENDNILQYVVETGDSSSAYNKSAFFGTTMTSGKFTTPVGTKYILFRLGSSTIDKVSINYPSSAASYHPYSESMKYYIGTLDIIRGELKITHNQVSLNSGALWVDYSGSVVNYQYKFKFEDRKFGSRSLTMCSSFDCNYAAIKPLVISWLNDSNSYIIGIVDTNNIYTLSDIQTLAESNQIVVIYELATPITIQLTPTEVDALIGQNNVFCDTGNVAVDYKNCPAPLPIRIPALVGTNNVFSDAGDVEVEYYKSTRIGGDD